MLDKATTVATILSVVFFDNAEQPRAEVSCESMMNSFKWINLYVVCWDSSMHLKVNRIMLTSQKKATPNRGLGVQVNAWISPGTVALSDP